jgi:hypothetical protein
MTETQQGVAAADVNPFDDSQFVSGGGLWDGKVVTITSAVAKTAALTRKDGTPVLDEKTKQQVVQTALYITGISDGPGEKERHEEYSVGDKLSPTPDGQGFVDKATGGAPKFHANSNFAKLLTALKGAGYPVGELYDVATRTQKLGRLVGARLMMKATPKLGKDGKAIKDQKGYDKAIHLPVQFVGRAAGSVASASGGNGHAAAAAASPLAAKAEAAVLGVLAAAPDSKLTRADLVRTLAQTLAGDPEANGVIGLVVRDDFHNGKPWKYDGSHASLT